jgi:hypothetical protein
MTYEEALAAYDSAEAVYELALVTYDKAEEAFEEACLERTAKAT